ncbi:MAG: septum formation inhibitor Maf [Winogradskyella sp.]|uniref:septum formation inhibitor Maf n=1 Tax=Winogradskyella sp. TaxID=1883156 RepID=UPI000F3C1DF3|nr:septum formation inhibitor Maf [Winogradskyella sp.]RNC86468.1 MAG: septum formation inhibitor Maf [Winogradskyella sp.]
MNNSLKGLAVFVSFMCALVIAISCKEELAIKGNDANIASAEPTPIKVSTPEFKPNKDFNDYWYAGEAEITSYKLEQARYGEIRQGTAVMVFVTEDFLPEKQVKADNYSKDNVSILKLNATKNFNTGIYPYSIMQSTFFPVANNQHAIKVSASIQEWCGHAYTQLNNRDNFEVTTHSYFQSEADQNFNIEKAITENEIWTQLRINPNALPMGKTMMIPSLEFIRLRHIPFKAYEANTTLKGNVYTIYYPELNRRLNIKFNLEFPYEIYGWNETSPSGYGPNANLLTTRAEKLKTIKSAYWGKNSNADESLRETLKLK